jgi:hypothetical protein
MTIRRGSGLSAGAFTGESVRPAGYQFPIGLSSQGLVSGTTGNVVASFVASGLLYHQQELLQLIILWLLVVEVVVEVEAGVEVAVVLVGFLLVLDIP